MIDSDRYNAWIVNVEEVDHGHRSPDGKVICLHLIEGQSFIRAKQGKVYYDGPQQYSEAVGEFKRCLLSSAGLEKLAKYNGLVWTEEKTFKHDIIFVEK